MMKKILMFVLVLGGQAFAAALSPEDYMNAAFDAMQDDQFIFNQLIARGQAIDSAAFVKVVGVLKNESGQHYRNYLQLVDQKVADLESGALPVPSRITVTPAQQPRHVSPPSHRHPSPRRRSVSAARPTAEAFMNAAFDAIADADMYQVASQGRSIENLSVAVERLKKIQVSTARSAGQFLASSGAVSAPSIPAPAPSVGRATFNYSIEKLAGKYGWVRSQVLAYDGRGGGNFANGSDEVYLPNSISSGGGVGSSSESSGASGEGFAAWADANRVPWRASVDGALAQIRVGEIDKPSLQDEFNTQLKARLGVNVATFEQGLRNHHLNDISDPVQRVYLQRYKDSLR